MQKRLNFFLSHLFVSILIALLVVGIVFFIWYPSPLAIAVGVGQIFLMMLVIDVIVGPILSFLVYKENKPSLKFDLIVVFSVQLLALVYGLYSIGQGKPAWLVYNVDRFELVRKNEVEKSYIAQVLPQYKYPSWFKPRYVAVELSKDAKTRNDDLFIELAGISIAQRPERYLPLLQVKVQIQKRAQELDLLSQFNDKNLVKATLAQYPQANAFVPLKANSVDMTVLINKEQGEVVRIVNLRPWK